MDKIVYEESLNNPAFRRGLAKQSRAFFAQHYLDIATPPHFIRWVKDYHTSQLFEGPRGHGKTMARSLVVPLHDIVFDRTSRILLIGKNQGEAMKRLKVCRDQLELNEKLIADFGMFKTGERTWTDHSFYVERPRSLEKDPTMEAVGLGGAITGGRFTRIVVDDPIDDKNVRNARIRKEMVDWLLGTVFELLVPGGQIDVILTRKHYQDLAYTLRKNKTFYVSHDKAIIRYPQNWTIIEEEINGQMIPVDVKIEGDPGECLCPEIWPMKKLLLKRQKVGSILFDRENQNIVQSETDSQFPLEHLEAAKEKGEKLGWIDQEKAKEMGFIIVQAWDLAFVDNVKQAEKTDSDYTVGLTVGFKPLTGERILCKATRTRGKTPYQVVNDMKVFSYEYPERIAVTVENNHLGTLHELELKRSTDLPIVGHRTDQKKADPWEGVPAMTVLFENGKWTLPYGTPEAKQFVDILTAELHGLGTETHDDTVMALWIAECAIRRYLEYLRKKSQGRPEVNRQASARLDSSVS